MTPATLCLIADWPTLGARLVPALAEVLAAVARGRVFVIERGDDEETLARLRRLERLVALCRDAGAPLMVSRRVDLALACGADGVHLPERGLATAAVRAAWPSLLVGRSCHARPSLLAAARAGAHYALLSPVAAPHSKPLGGASPLGVAGFGAAAAGVGLPVYALGGVTAELAPGLRRAGAAGLAALGGVLGAADPGRRARDLLAAWDVESPEVIGPS